MSSKNSKTASKRKPKKQSSSRLSSIAASVMRDDYNPTRAQAIADAKTLAGSVLSQDETPLSKSPRRKKESCR